jgi:coronatine-insensitive protein 1
MEGRRQRQSQELLQQQVVALSDENLSRIFELIESPQERATLSLVCRQWHRVDGNTRKNISIANMYAVAPTALTRRFKCLEGIKLKGKPRAAEYDLLLPEWGGYAYPWLKELATAYEHLKTLQFRRVEVRNADLYLLAAAPFNATLQVLHLHKCSGFTTSGLVPLSRTCRSLRVLSLEDSDVIDEGGEWLHALAQNNSVLESLDFAVPGLDTASVKDLAFLVGRCKSLVSLKVGDMDMSDLAGVLSKVPFLKDLGTGGFSDLGDENKGMAASINLSQHLTSLSGLWAMPDIGLQMVQPVAANLKKLDLKFTVLSRRGHCELLSHCFALEELQVCMSPLVLQSWLTKTP